MKLVSFPMKPWMYIRSSFLRLSFTDSTGRSESIDDERVSPERHSSWYGGGDSLEAFVSKRGDCDLGRLYGVKCTVSALGRGDTDVCELSDVTGDCEDLPREGNGGGRGGS